MQNILVLIDLQNDFILPTGKLTVNAPELIYKTQAFLEKSAGFFTQIYVTKDTHYRHSYPQTAEAKLFPPHCIYGTRGWQTAIPIEPSTHVILKSQTDVWQKKETLLHRLSYQNATVYLAGVCADICVEQAMQGFLARNATVRILTDLTKGYTLSATAVLNKPQYAVARQKGQLKGLTSTAFLAAQKTHVR